MATTRLLVRLRLFVLFAFISSVVAITTPEAVAHDAPWESPWTRYADYLGIHYRDGGLRWNGSVYEFDKHATACHQNYERDWTIYSIGLDAQGQPVGEWRNNIGGGGGSCPRPVSHLTQERPEGASHLWVQIVDSGNRHVYREMSTYPYGPYGSPTVKATQVLGASSSPHQKITTVQRSDPVNTATGNFAHSETDLGFPGIGIPFVFSRSYNSADTSTRALGKGWSHNLQASLSFPDGIRAVFKAEDGRELTFVKTDTSDAYFAPAGALSSLSSITGGYRLTRPDQTIYEFNTSGQLTKVEDSNEQALTLQHTSGLLSKVVDTVGREILFEHSNSRLTKVTLPDGRFVTYSYTSDRLTTFTDVLGGTVTYTYDANGLMTKIVDQNGNTVVENTYDSEGRVQKQLDPLGNESTFGWVSGGGLVTATMTDAKGGQWVDVYRDYVLQKSINPLGHATSYQHSSGGFDLTSVTDAKGNTTSMTYDNRGNLLSTTSPAPFNHQVTFTYDSMNNPISTKDTKGRFSTFTYDSDGNLTQSRGPDGQTTTFSYDSVEKGLLRTVTNPLNKTTNFSYDSSGNLTQIQTPLGNKTTFLYDGSGRVTGTVEPRGNVSGANASDYMSHTFYDNANRVTKTRDPLGNETNVSYDSVGNVSATVDVKGRSTRFGYNRANELVTVTAADNSQTLYAYDAVGNTISRTDAKGHVTTYEYDLAKRLTKVTKPLDRIHTMFYDSVGNVTQTVDANGNSTTSSGDGTTNFTFDALGRTTAVDYSDATADLAFTYDASDNVTQITAGGITQTYSYDVMDRVTEVKRAGVTEFTYGYDAVGSVTTRGYPGASHSYTYDDDGRMSGISSQGVNYSYDPAGRLLASVLPNGVTETMTYDRAGRLTEVAQNRNGAVTSFNRYSYDEVGNPTSTVTERGTTTYTYDLLDRLLRADCDASECSAAPSITYTYDQVGNRLTESKGGVTATYSYNDADELQSAVNAGVTTNFTHDKNGNRTSKGSTSYEWDLAGRLTKVDQPSHEHKYFYAGSGERTKVEKYRKSPSYELDRAWTAKWDANAGLPLLASETEEVGSTTSKWTYGQGLVGTTTDTATSYYHHDGLSSITGLSGSDGSTAATRTYEPFGLARSEQGAATDPMRFTGQYRDDTGLYYLRARYYDPETGNFLSTDPLSSGPMCVSAYAYVNNQPTSLIDPSGMRGSKCNPGASGGAHMIGNFFAGWGDEATFGGTSKARDLLGGANDAVNKCSGFYTAGQVGGFLNTLFIPAGAISKFVSGGKIARAAPKTNALVKYHPDFAVGQLTSGGKGSASQLVDFAESQGWKRFQSSTGPIKYLDESGIERLVLKQGSPRTPGSNYPHVSIRNAAGDRIDPYGNLVSRRSPGNHTPIDWDLP